jgi:hypothetical protein
MFQDAIEFVDAVVADYEFTRAILRVLDTHLRDQFLCHLDLQYHTLGPATRRRMA